MWTIWSIIITMSRPPSQTPYSLTERPSIVRGRPRRFVPAEALRHALEVFWDNGYDATSLDDLTAAMHLSRSSVYACFGSKHAVLMASVELYADEVFARLNAIAASGIPASDVIHAVLAAIADIDAGLRGCFFVNCVSELAPHDSALKAFAQQHITRIGTLVVDQLLRVGFTQELAQARAAAMLALAVGTITLRKAGIPAPQLLTILNQAHLLLADAPFFT